MMVRSHFQRVQWIDAVSHDEYRGEMTIAPLGSYVLKLN